MTRRSCSRRHPDTGCTATGHRIWVAIAAAFLTAVPPSYAATRFSVISHAPKPPQCGADEPNQAPGAWIQNKSCGYWIGTAIGGGTFDSHKHTASWYRYGRHGGASPNMCGWIPQNSVENPSGTVPDSCSEETERRLAHRVRIGRDFNAVAHSTDHGAPVPANQTCTLYYNYFRGSDLLHDGGAWANPAGSPQPTVLYRYTTRDCGAVVVRDPVLGWGFLPRECVQRPATLYNDDDVEAFPLQPDAGECPPIQAPPPPEPQASTAPWLMPVLSLLLGDESQVCGNGVVEGSEQCDDGNTQESDCCSPRCTFESASTICGTGCDGKLCDGAGTCQ